jgi:hypothetical protein
MLRTVCLYGFTDSGMFGLKLSREARMFHPVPRADRWDPIIVAAVLVLFGVSLFVSVVWSN